MHKKWLVAWTFVISFWGPAHAVQTCTLCSTDGDSFYGCFQTSNNPNYQSDTPQGVLLRAYGEVRSGLSEGPSYTCSIAAPTLGPLISSVGVPDGAFTRVYTYSYSYVDSRRFGQCFEPTTRTFTSTSGGVTCYQYPQVVGFFNGVWNTQLEAGDGLKALQLLMKPVFSNLDVDYDVFYNTTGCDWLKVTCLRDIAETFAQRGGDFQQVAAKRWELFWDVLRGRHATSDSAAGKMAAEVGAAGGKLTDALQATFQALLTTKISQMARLMTTPPTEQDMASHKSKVADYAGKGYKMVFVAHSQGNLFANAAYDHLKNRYTNPYFVRLVHLAPASAGVRGLHILVDIDLVINGLRAIGGAPRITMSIPTSIGDLSGHMLIETYLDGSRAGRQWVLDAIRDAMAVTSNPNTIPF